MTIDTGIINNNQINSTDINTKEDLIEAHRKNWLYHRDKGNLIAPNVPSVFVNG